MPATVSPTPEDAIATIREMISVYRGIGPGTVTTRQATPGLFGCVHGLRAHAYALAEAADPLWDSPTTQVACLPLARSAFECGILAQWLVREPRGLDALIAEHQRQTVLLHQQTAKAPELAGRLAPLADAPAPTSELTPIVRNMEKLCKQFSGGEALYTFYRMLSRYSHAGLQVAGEWLGPPNAAGSGAPFRLRTAREPEKAFAVFFGWGLLFTASAFNDLSRPGQHESNNQLNQWARRMGIQRRLTLLPEADRAR